MALAESLSEHDFDNLNFLLALDAEGFRKWAHQADEDDLKYAEELFQNAREILNNESDEIVYVNQAREVLSRFVKNLK